MEYLAGAAMALVGSVFVQTFVVPRVTRRAKAIDRWENDVLVLGVLVSDELSIARDRAFKAWNSWKVLRQVTWTRSWPDEKQQQLASEDRQRAESFRAEWREYERLVRVRLHWLAKRVSSRDQKHSTYLQLEILVLSLGMLPIELLDDRWTADNVDAIEQWWKKEAEDRALLQRQVEELAASIAAPSPIGPLGRVQRWRERRRRRRRKDA